MKRLRVGVLGLGAFGESHIRAYRGLPYVELAAVASRSAERAGEIAERYEIPVAYGAYEALIADVSIDAISVTTAEHEHREPVIAALSAGKHVLVEKPIASTMEDAAAMVEAARTSAGILMPGHILRFAPAYAGVKAAVRAGELGRVVSMSARRNRSAALIESHGRVHPALITAIHDIDVMLWLAGCEVERVRAVDRIAERDGGAHGLWGMLEFADRTVAMLETSWLLPADAEIATDDAFHVTGMLGTAKVQVDVPPLRVWTASGSTAPDVSYEPDMFGVVSGALGNELAHFAQCALAGTPSAIVSPEDGARALAVVLALMEAAETGEAVVPEVVG
ncbi:MAG TPA: Gfo/Idh/MocA family oxidoreductase [Thermomicrobiales bacterium]|nr:Gfo/Idh/MocA family oxidoreductase [Thermomicrobiales bacterium]